MTVVSIPGVRSGILLLIHSGDVELSDHGVPTLQLRLYIAHLDIFSRVSADQNLVLDVPLDLVSNHFIDKHVCHFWINLPVAYTLFLKLLVLLSDRIYFFVIHILEVSDWLVVDGFIELTVSLDVLNWSLLGHAFVSLFLLFRWHSRNMFDIRFRSFFLFFDFYGYLSIWNNRGRDCLYKGIFRQC